MKYFKDPIGTIESETKKINDNAEKITKPVMQKYPFTFALLFTFALASVIHGFELMLARVKIFYEYPVLLVVLGIIILLLTGGLYKNLSNK